MFKRNKKKFILMVGEEGGILTELEGKKVIRRLFASEPDGAPIKPFLDAFAEHPDVPLYLLIDVMDQSYLQQMLPPVSAMSVNKLVKRRLERDFSDQDITGALRIGKDTGGRRDWEYLFVSLADAPPLSKWLEAVSDLPNRCKGMFLLPVESQLLIQRLAAIVSTEKGNPPAKWQLLVCHNKVGGFRQVVLRDGKLAFTRLTQSLGVDQPEVIAGNIEQEVLNTTEYLKRLGFNPADGLDIYVIGARQIIDALEIHNVETRVIKTMTPFEAASKLGLDDAVQEADRFADTILSTYFGQAKRCVLRLMTKYLKKLETLYSLRLVMRSLLLLTTPLLMGWAGTSVWDTHSLSTTISQQTAQKKELEDQIKVAMQRQAVLPEDFIMMSDMIELHEVITRYSSSPLPDVKSFAMKMQESMRVKDIKWQESVPAGRNNGSKDFSITLDIPVTHSKASAFAAGIKEFVNQLKSAFPEHEISHSKIPGVIEEDEQLDITFDSNQSAQRVQLTPGEIIPVTINIKSMLAMQGGKRR